MWLLYGVATGNRPLYRQEENESNCHLSPVKKAIIAITTVSSCNYTAVNSVGQFLRG